MLLAGEKDFEQVKSIFYKHKKWFPHVRTDYMRRMIAKEQLILEDGILITFHHAKRKQTIGNVHVRKGDTVLHQIANSEPGSGNAKTILTNFFDWCARDVFLSVRSDNKKACKFYEDMGMLLVGETSWAKGTLPGKVYVMRK